MNSAIHNQKHHYHRPFSGLHRTQAGLEFTLSRLGFQFFLGLPRSWDGRPAPPGFKNSCVHSGLYACSFTYRLHFSPMQDAACIPHRLLSHCVGSTEHMTSRCQPSVETKHCYPHRRVGSDHHSEWWGTASFPSLETAKEIDIMTQARTVPSVPQALLSRCPTPWLSPVEIRTPNLTLSWRLTLDTAEWQVRCRSLLSGQQKNSLSPSSIPHHSGTKRSQADTKCGLGEGEPHPGEVRIIFFIITIVLLIFVFFLFIYCFFFFK